MDKVSDNVTQAQKQLPSVITILGDFNLGDIYLTPEHTNNSGITNFDILFQETMYGLNLRQLICEPTRVTDRTANLRDLILVSDQQYISEQGLLSPFSHIDHIPTFASLKIPIAHIKTYKKEIWNYREMDIDSYIQIFENKDWTEITGMEINEAVNALTNFILSASNQCIPKCVIVIKEKDKPWVRKALKINIKVRNKLFRKAKVLNTEDSWSRWKVQRNLVTSMNRKLKNRHITHQVSRLLEHKQNPKKYHQILKRMLGRGHVPLIPSLVDVNNKLIENNTDKANLINDFFASQSEEILPENDISLRLPDKEIPSIEGFSITEDEVFSQLKALKVNKAIGPDIIPNKILKLVAIFLEEPLTKIFNKSLAEGKYPSPWKHFNVIPVFKNKGFASDVKS